MRYLIWCLFSVSIAAGSTCTAAHARESLGLADVERQLETLGDGEESAASRALYEQALAFIAQRDTFEARRQDDLNTLQTAPKLSEEVQARLDGYGSKPEPEALLSGFTQEELVSRLSLARAELAELRTRVDEIHRQSSARNAARITSRLDAIRERLAELPGLESLDMTDARAVRNTAERLALVAETSALSTSLETLPVRGKLNTLETAELELLIDRQTLLVRAIETRLEAARDQQALAVTLAPDDPAFAVARTIADADNDVLSQWTATAEKQQQLRTKLNELETRKRLIEDRRDVAQRLTESASESDSAADILLGYWADINAERSELHTNVTLEVGDAMAERLRLEAQLRDVLSAPVFLEKTFVDLDVDPSAAAPSSQATLLDMTRTYRETLRSTLAAKSQYIEDLNRLAAETEALNELRGDYRGMMGSLVQWIPSHPPLWSATLGSLRQEAMDTIERYTERLRVQPTLRWLVLLLLAGLLMAGSSRLAKYQHSLSFNVNRPRADAMRATLLAACILALRALPIPLAILSVCHLTYLEFDELLQLTGHGVLLLFALLFLRCLCEPSGLASVHFQWSDDMTRRVTEEANYLIRWWLPTAIAAALSFTVLQAESNFYLARAFLLASILMLGWHMAVQNYMHLKAPSRAWLEGWPSRVRLLILISLSVLAIAVIYGQTYTVIQLVRSIGWTFLVGTAAIFVHALLMRWLRISRRRLRFAELVAQREAAQQDIQHGDEDVANLVDVSAETQELVSVFAAVAFVVGLYFIWRPLLPALDALDNWVFWSWTTQTESASTVNDVTAGTVLAVLVLVTLTLYLAKRLPALVEIVLRQRTTVSAGARYTVSTVMNYLIVGTGLIYALSTLGLQWSELQWLVAALGVGIGFGLQEIVANFISGLIILFERPVRVGDVVTVGGKDGTVTKIRIRATTIRDWDGKELLVPNKEFITGHLLNWSLSDSQTRVVIPVGIAYGSDVKHALDILKAVVVEHPHTLREPEPLIVFEHFGDNALELSARCFLDSLDDRMRIMTELRVEINEAFEAAGIVIAFPQRDVHLDGELRLLPSIEGSD